MKLYKLLEELENKEEEYKNYIEEHIKNTQKAWDLVQPKLKGEYKLSPEMKEKIDELIKSHDASKFSKEEFEPYRQYFYTKNNEAKNKEVFDKAWLHHYTLNKHHWQHWVGQDMPLEYIIEQLCDWKAMSIKFGDTPQAYYNKEKKNIKFSPETKKLVEKWIKIF